MLAGMFASRAAGGGSVTPPWANVVSLLHYGGTDGSTTFTDEKGRIWTPAGNAQIDTAQSPFGDSSGLFDGTGDYINTPSSSDFAYGTGDFTWETWVRFASLAGNQYILDHGSNRGTLQMNGGVLKYYNPTTGINSPLYVNGGGGALSIDTWYHIAVARAGGTTRYFRNGILNSSDTDAHNFDARSLRLGTYGGGGNALNGWLAETRLVKGVACYTSNFTPPSGPLPDS